MPQLECQFLGRSLLKAPSCTRIVLCAVYSIVWVEHRVESQICLSSVSLFYPQISPPVTRKREDTVFYSRNIVGCAVFCPVGRCTRSISVTAGRVVMSASLPVPSAPPTLRFKSLWTSGNCYYKVVVHPVLFSANSILGTFCILLLKREFSWMNVLGVFKELLGLGV